MTIVRLIQRIVAAFQHVRTGGRTTRTRAVRKAEAPPKRCPTCGQEVPHSADWRDHIHA